MTPIAQCTTSLLIRQARVIAEQRLKLSVDI